MPIYKVEMFKQKTQPHLVTTLGTDANKDYKNRMRNYSIIMGLRFLCIALALIIPFPWNIIPIIFAVCSPWFAVLIANNKKPTIINEIEKPTFQIEK